MVRLDDIIGDIIYISFRDVEGMHEIGIQKPSGHYMLKGFDQMGLWLEHPGILIQHMEDKQGHLLPIDQQSQEEVDAVFMVRWNNVNTMMHYPNREGFDFPDQFRKNIGFLFKDKTTALNE